MLGFSPRAARFAWTVALVAAALYLLLALRRTLFIFILAVFFAYMVYPLIMRLTQLAPRKISRTTSTAVVFLFVVLALCGIGAIIGPSIADQAVKLSEQLPNLTRGVNALDRVAIPAWLQPYRGRLEQFLRDNLQSGASYAMPVAKQVGTAVLAVATNAIYVVVIPILAFLLITEGPGMRNRFLRWADGRRHGPMWRGFCDDLDDVLGGYMRALLILSLATVCVYSAAFMLFGVPYGLLLAALAGALEFIPVLGPFVAVVACMLVALVSGYDHPLLLLLFFGAYRVFQDYVLNPYLMSDRVSIAPVFVLFGLLAGEELGGVIGIFLSVPVLASAKIAIERIAQEARRTRLATHSPPSSNAVVVEAQTAAALPTSSDP